MKHPDPIQLDRRERSRPLWRYAWAFPASAIGLGLAWVARTGGATMHRVDGVLEVAGGAFGRAVARLPAPFRFCAITFGHVVVGVDHRVLAQCRTHEHAHVRQYERWGLLFFPLYAASSLWEAVRGKAPYRDNYFERQARAAADVPAHATTEETGA
jgi:hypothetical protein